VLKKHAVGVRFYDFGPSEWLLWSVALVFSSLWEPISSSKRHYGPSRPLVHSE